MRVACSVGHALAGCIEMIMLSLSRALSLSVALSVAVCVMKHAASHCKEMTRIIEAMHAALLLHRVKYNPAEASRSIYYISFSCAVCCLNDTAWLYLELRRS